MSALTNIREQSEGLNFLKYFAHSDEYAGTDQSDC
jgi:hypothetical protein